MTTSPTTTDDKVQGLLDMNRPGQCKHLMKREADGFVCEHCGMTLASLCQGRESDR